MSSITISDLGSTGSELFSDSESYLSELTQDELSLLHGALFREIGVVVGVISGGLWSGAVSAAGSAAASAAVSGTGAVPSGIISAAGSAALSEAAGGYLLGLGGLAIDVITSLP